jgi:hypothetical protein
MGGFSTSGVGMTAGRRIVTTLIAVAAVVGVCGGGSAW